MTATVHHPVVTTELPGPPPPEPAERPVPRVVTVFSPKGGAGTTVVATNMAVALHAGSVRVCLLDLALAFGDIAVSLQLVPSRTVVDALELGTSLEAVNELVTTHPSGLDCVLAPVDPSGLERVPVHVIRGLLAALRTRYDVVVIDTPSELSEHVLEAIDTSDRLVIVTTPEIPAIKNTRIALDMLDLLGHPQDQRTVVLNQVDPALGITAADVAGALQHPVAAELPFDRAVPQSVNHGVPLIAAQPTHAISQELRSLAAQTVGGMSLVGTPSVRIGRLRRGRRSA